MRGGIAFPKEHQLPQQPKSKCSVVPTGQKLISHSHHFLLTLGLEGSLPSNDLGIQASLIISKYHQSPAPQRTVYPSATLGVVCVQMASEETDHGTGETPVALSHGGLEVTPITCLP